MCVYYRIAVFFLFLLGTGSVAIADYCDAWGNPNNADPYITSVIMESIANLDTQNNGYSDYSSQYMISSPGSEHEMFLSLSSITDATVGIWVDWNQDFDFDDLNETVFIFTPTTTSIFRKTITIPENAASGFCRLRIMICWKKDPNSCGQIVGEVEDYSIYIESPSPYSGGMGTIDNPHLISTPQDLNEISSHPAHWNQHFLMTNDIDMSQLAGSSKNPIGNFDTKFTGTFDGGSHAVYNFNYNDASDSFVALFGYVDSDTAQIKDLRLINPNVSAANYVATLVGTFGTDGQPLLQNCSVKGGSITGTQSVGGLVAQAISGQIVNCYTDTTVSASGKTAGGFIAFTGSNSTIINSYSTSTVQCPNTVGGFVGTYSGQIENCYSAGFVSSGAYTGGFAGSSMGGSVLNCFWDKQASNQPTSSAATGLNTILMQTQSTYTAKDWNFTDTWHICEQTNYPKLRWQIPSADIACPYGVNIEDILTISEKWLLTKQSYDTMPAPNGDGIVDFLDFTDFAETYDPQNISALYDFCDQWLQDSLTAGDIAPVQSPDGNVNFADFVILADQWLEEIK